jgi:hypothetical protein
MSLQKELLPGLWPGRPRFGSAVAWKDRMESERPEEEEEEERSQGLTSLRSMKVDRQ